MTDKERWNRVKELLFAAAELKGEERERFLAAQCATPEERAEVEQRLVTSAPTEFMKTPVLGKLAGASLSAGDRLGRYEIQALLGQGGGGAVYRALDTSLRRQVALKLLAPDLASDALSLERFTREAEAASALNHPNIVTIYEIGSEGATHFIAMEYIAGKSLRDQIRKQGLKLDQFFPWAIQMADGLAAAHASGIVHRDIKPGNVMITERGIAKIVDFGLAKAVRNEEDQKLWDTITQQGTTAGTCAYMSPEQAEAQPVDARSDIFSFGAVLHEMITGKRAFPGESSLSAIGRILHAEPTPLRQLAPECPAGLESLVVNCLRKAAAERWQSAADIKLVLEELQREWQAGPGQERRQRRGLLWPATAAVAAGCALTAAAFLWLRPAPATSGLARITALTMDGGLTMSPSLSADGKLLAYASDRAGDGSLDIWVQQVGGRSPIRLTRDPADERDPDLSPDGTQVVFRSEKEGGGIYVMPALGGEPVLLAQGGRNPKFSPDGKWVAYWTGKEGSSLSAGSAQAYFIPAGGGQARPPGGNLVAAMYPLWSSDGSKLLVVGRKDASLSTEPLPDWWIVPRESGAAISTGVVKTLRSEPRTVSPPVWQSGFIPLAWEKRGSVFFAAQRADAINLWSVAVDPQTGHSSGKLTRITQGTGADAQAAFTDLIVAFCLSTRQVDMWGLPLDTERGVRRGELVRITEDLASEAYPSLSWDASRMAYTVKRGPEFSLVSRDMRSGKTSDLLTSRNLPIPRLSGDGEWLVFGEYPGNISRIPWRGGAVERICERCGTPKSVSFDGSRILLEPLDSPEDVRALDMPSKQITSFVRAKGPLYSGEMSHDGKWVAFLSSEARPNSRVYVARVENGKAAPDSEWIPITAADAAYRGPHWSPGGNVLYFLSDRDGFRCIWASRLDPASKTPLGPLFAVEHFHHARRALQHVNGFDDSPLAIGGDMAVVVIGEIRGNIWMRDQKPQ